ncbi:hypothetical protein V8G54_025809, partial [Vigna mungo]
IEASDGGDTRKQRESRKNMGRFFVMELEGRSYRCKFCSTHLALADDLISRSFHCRKGKAYLFNNVLKFPATYSEFFCMLCKSQSSIEIALYVLRIMIVSCNIHVLALSTCVLYKALSTLCEASSLSSASLDLDYISSASGASCRFCLLLANVRHFM